MIESIWQLSRGILFICLLGSTIALSLGHGEVTKMLMVGSSNHYKYNWRQEVDLHLRSLGYESSVLLLDYPAMCKETYLLPTPYLGNAPSHFRLTAESVRLLGRME